MSQTVVRSLQAINSIAGFQFIGTRGVRHWNRKPLGSPTAKSKLFRLPQKHFVPDDERNEMRRLHKNYNSQMKAIRQYFYEELQKQADTGAAAQALHKTEEEEHVRLMEENRMENEKTAKLREERLARELVLVKQKAERVRQQIEVEKQQMLEEIEAFVREQKVKASEFISRDSIEKSILEALANPVDFNFAISKDGYVLRGKTVNIDNIPPEQRERLVPSSV